MPKFTLQQVINGVCYSKAIYDFLTSDGFNNCFKALAVITRPVLKKLNYPEPIPVFDEFTDQLEYYDRLERVFDFSPNQWKSNVEKFTQFISEAKARRPEFDELEAPFQEFLTTLKNLRNGENMNISLESEDAMDITEPPPDEKDIPNYLPTPKYPSTYAITQPNMDNCYAINKTGKRGLCLIVNIYRVGATADVTDAVELFEHLNYEVMKFDNVTSIEYSSKQRDIRNRIEQLKSDSFIMIFSSHGDEKYVQFADEKKMTRDEIILRFLPAYCPQLDGKPKLFFFQNCRGNDAYPRSDNTDMSDYDPPPAPIPDDTSTETSDACYSPETVSKSLPKDIVKYFATTEGHVAYRLDMGSIFLQSLFEILRDDQVNRKTFNDIQPILTRKVLESSKHSGDQLPDFHTTMIKQFYFRNPNM